MGKVKLAHSEVLPIVTLIQNMQKTGNKKGVLCLFMGVAYDMSHHVLI